MDIVCDFPTQKIPLRILKNKDHQIVLYNYITNVLGVKIRPLRINDLTLLRTVDLPKIGKRLI